MNIRKRLVAWHTGILAGLLLIFTFGVYMTLRFHLNTEVDDSLKSWAADVIESVAGNAPDVSGGFRTSSSHIEPPFNMPESFALTLDPKEPISSDFAGLSKSGLLSLQNYLKTHVVNPHGTYGTIPLNAHLFRIYVKEMIPPAGNKVSYLILGRSLMHVQNTLSGLIGSLILAWLIAVLVCTVVSWLFVGRTLRPVKMMTQDALKIATSKEPVRKIENFGEHDEFGELSKALNQMLASIEASYTAQKKFLADASHELRTPLTSIKANLDFINRAKQAPESEKKLAFEDITTEVNRMASLVNELLMLARAEAPKAEVNEKFNLPQLINKVYSENWNRKSKLNRLILLEIADSVLYVNTDPEKIRQVVVILLDNAVKYSPVKSEIKLRVWRQGTSAMIEVNDQGPGIPEAELPLVLNRFYRGSNVRNNTEGSGLGLSIVKSILTNLEGEIELSNRNPNGLRARITLPLAK
ncbi:MAG TPA: HAMP domain-containing sensor histidine kinase [Bacillota bacterium]|nr:HAMP domain-containing sensor histidine kinase [Bacillota bacterium]